MKKLSFVLVPLIALFIAGTIYAKLNPEEAEPETITIEVGEGAKTPDFQVGDSTGYSPEFLRALKKGAVEDLKLNGDTLIVAGRDTHFLPQQPPIGKYLVMTARQGDLATALTLERRNFSTLDYRLEMVEFGFSSHKEEGQIHLSPDFYRSNLQDTLSKPDQVFPVFAYGHQQGACRMTVRLGNRGKYPQILGRLIRNCNGNLQDLRANNYPILMEK